MSADLLFSLTNYASLAGWIVVIFGVIRNRPYWVKLAGRAVPLMIASAYGFIAPFYFTSGQGDFGSLAGLVAMSADPWLTLGGWMHYMAADLFIGSSIALRVLEKQWNRAWLILILPFCAMVGPLGFLIYHVVALAHYRRNHRA